MLKALLALVFAVIAIGSFYFFQTKTENASLYGIVGIVSIILAVVFGIMFMSGRVNKTEDIHITE